MTPVREYPLTAAFLALVAAVAAYMALILHVPFP